MNISKKRALLLAQLSENLALLEKSAAALNPILRHYFLMF
jgi:hypothetical protein